MDLPLAHLVGLQVGQKKQPLPFVCFDAFVMCEPCGPAYVGKTKFSLMSDASGKLEIDMHSRGYGPAPLGSI